MRTMQHSRVKQEQNLCVANYISACQTSESQQHFRRAEKSTEPNALSIPMVSYTPCATLEDKCDQRRLNTDAENDSRSLRLSPPRLLRPCPALIYNARPMTRAF